MKTVIQRVKSANVTVDGAIKGKIDKGFLIFIAVEENDTEQDAEILAAKISGLRIFTDENDKMNLSLSDVNASVLVISNFTLCADCKKGRRPYFSGAAKPQKANELYEYFCKMMNKNGITNIQKGVFGADMQVSLINDGPVTIPLNSQDLQ